MTPIHDTYTHADDGRVCVLGDDGLWWVSLNAGGESFNCVRVHGAKPVPAPVPHTKEENIAFRKKWDAQVDAGRQAEDA